MTALHATEPRTVYLSLHARVDGVRADDIDRALFEDRTLVEQLVMRWTLFVFPLELLPAALGSAALRVAREQRRLISRGVEQHVVAADGRAWLDAASRAVLDRFAGAERLSLPGVDVGADGRAALTAEAARVTAWLEGDVITNVYTAHLQKRLPLP